MTMQDDPRAIFDDVIANDAGDDYMQSTRAFDARIDGTGRDRNGNGHHEPAVDDEFTATWRGQLIDGRTWLNSAPPNVTPLWGDARTGEVLAAQGQPTIAAGFPGASKTTTAQHLTLGRIGVPGYENVLGYPVSPIAEGSKALYLASDRPEQARLSLARLVTTDHELAILHDRLVVWQGPPPIVLDKRPKLLLEMAQAAGASFVVVDSLKDMAHGISEDEIGSQLNFAHQLLVSNGIDVITLHHPRKRNAATGEDNRPTIDDLYGSSWIGAGAGSVLFFIKEPTSVEIYQAKAPLGDGISVRFRHDTKTGAIKAGDEDEVLAAVRDSGTDGLTTPRVAAWVHHRDATNAEIEAIRRRLKQLEALGLVEKRRGTKANAGDKWVAT